MAILDTLFGGSSQAELLGGLLGEDKMNQLRSQAAQTGLINAAIGYFAQPKNQRFGSALPYIARSLVAGQQGAQNVYDDALRNYQLQQRLEEVNREKAARAEFEKARGNLFTTTPAQYQEVTLPGGYSPQQTEVQTGQVAPNYGLTKLPDVTQRVMTAPEKQVMNEQALQQMILSGDPRATSYLTGLKTIKELSTPVKKDLMKLGAEEVVYDPNTNTFVQSPLVKQPFKIGQTRDIQRGTTNVTQEYQGAEKGWVDISAGPKFSPTALVNIDQKGEGKYEETLGTEMAKKDTALFEAGQSATKQLDSARRVKKLLTENPITGTGAEAVTALNNAFATAGLIDPQRGVTTEALSADLARATLDNIRSSGLGAGQGFSNADRDFLEKAAGGKITMNAESIKYLANLNERSAIATIQKYNDRLRRMKPEKREYYGLDFIAVPEANRPEPRLR
jgi:hypothetical protein